MSTPVLTADAQAQCPHGVAGTLAPSASKVEMDGALVLLGGDQVTFSGCPFTVPPSKPQPCVSAVPSLTASKVMVEGAPVLLMNMSDMAESAEKIANGPAIWAVVQQKVTAA